MSGFVATVQSFRQGAHTMPARYYTSPEGFAREQEHLLESRWLCVGRVEQLAEPGSYFLQQIGVESIIVLRDRKGVLRAFYNVCRHRGTRICEVARDHLW